MDSTGNSAAEEIIVRRNAGFAWQMPLCRRELTAVLAVMRATGNLASMPLELTLTDDAFISETNAASLDCPGPTNILAFPPFAGLGPSSGTEFPGTGLLLLSLDTLQREAFLYGQDTAEHALRLLAHGMAHLAGFDHGPVMDVFAETIFEAGRRKWREMRL